MASKVKINDQQGTQVFPITHVSAVLDNYGNSVEQILGAQTDLINQKQLEVGAVPSDLEPTEGSSHWVTSGGIWSSLAPLGLQPYQNGEVISLSELVEYPCFLNTDGTFLLTTGAKGVFVPIGNADKITVVANVNEGYTLTKSLYSTGDTEPDYATGYTGRITISAGESETITNFPADAKYIFLNITSGSTDTTPQSVTVVSTKNIIEKVSDLEQYASISESLLWENVDDSQYIQIDVDSSYRIHHAVLRDGRHWFPAGVIAPNSGNYADRPSDGYENFVYDVDVIKDVTSSNSMDSIITSTSAQDRGIICLPVNYNASGEAVRLVLVQPGTTYNLTSSSTKPVRTMPDVDLLLAEGYAVMQINGTPGELSGTSYGSVGNPEFIECFLAAYKYVTEKYNIRKDGIFVSGYSQGSLTSLQVSYLTAVPVLAALSYGPAQSFIMMYCHVDSTMRQTLYTKFAFAEKIANDKVVEVFPSLSGMTVPAPTTFSGVDAVPNDAEKAYLLNNIEKWIGYDMMLAGTSNIAADSLKYITGNSGSSTNENNVYKNATKKIGCPLKIWVADNDPTTVPKYAMWLQEMINNGGGLCSVRHLSTGGHAYPDISNSMTVSTKYGGTVTTKAISWEGLKFIEMFDF